jgi:hypothetical protein
MLTFEAETHTYALDGIAVPSVTGILKWAGLIDFSHLPAFVLERAQARGTAVHAAIHYFNERDLDVAGFASEFPDYVGYLDAWRAFCAERRFTPVLNEIRLASRRYRVAGTADCFGVLDGEAVLLDFATGRPQDVCKDLQTAAYDVLAREYAEASPALGLFLAAHPVIRRYAVALRANGTFQLEAYRDPAARRQFLALVEAYHIVAARRPTAPAVAAYLDMVAE